MYGRFVNMVDDLFVRIAPRCIREAIQFVDDQVSCCEVSQFVRLQIHPRQKEEMNFAGNCEWSVLDGIFAIAFLALF